MLPILLALAVATPLPGAWSQTGPPAGGNAPRVDEGSRESDAARIREVIAKVEADEWAPVTCLLTPRIRKLGRHRSIGPRRLIHTTALDCARRGGESIYDRADYSAALRVWQQAAESGDPAAQYHLATMYEEGLTSDPDYARAAAWYRKAAEKGHTAAQIHLGYLYEKGLGVEQDPREALRWYREAAELPETIKLDSRSSRDPQAELAALRAEVARREREEARLRDELRRAQTALRSATETERLAREQVGRLESELTARESELAALDGADPRGAELEQQVASLRDELRAQRAAARDSERAAGELRAQLDAAAARNERLERQRLAAESLALDHERTVDRLDEAERNLRAKRDEIDRLNGEIAALRQRLGEQNEAESARNAAERDAAVAERELRRKQEELEFRAERIAELEQDIRRHNEQLETIVRQAQESNLAQQAKLASGEIAGPAIEMIEPSSVSTRGIRVVQAGRAGQQVIGKIVAPAGLMSFLVDGADRSELLNEHGVFRVEVPADERKPFMTIKVVDEQGKHASVEIELAPAGNIPAQDAERAADDWRFEIDFGGYHALIIGNSGYQKWQPLQTPISDARRVAEVLESKYGFETTILIDAGRDEIMRSLQRLSEELTDSDNLLIYFAGHGHFQHEGKSTSGFWIPVEGGLPDDIWTWIEHRRIGLFTDKIRAKQILVVADSCYPALITRSALPTPPGPDQTEAQQRNFLETYAQKPARVALTSGGTEPVNDGGGGENSVFARAFLDVLEQNGDIISGMQLFQAVSGRVSYAAEVQGLRDQVPEYGQIRFAEKGEGGDFFFVPRR